MNPSGEILFGLGLVGNFDEFSIVEKLKDLVTILGEVVLVERMETVAGPLPEDTTLTDITQVVQERWIARARRRRRILTVGEIIGLGILGVLAFCVGHLPPQLSLPLSVLFTALMIIEITAIIIDQWFTSEDLGNIDARLQRRSGVTESRLREETTRSLKLLLLSNHIRRTSLRELSSAIEQFFSFAEREVEQQIEQQGSEFGLQGSMTGNQRAVLMHLKREAEQNLLSFAINNPVIRISTMIMRTD